MRKPLRKLAIPALTLGFYGLVASAQAPVATDVLMLEVDDLVDEGYIDAEILDISYDERKMTVEIDATQETAQLIVPSNADIVRTAPNNIEHEIEFMQLRPGEEVSLEAVEIEGVTRVRIVGVTS